MRIDFRTPLRFASCLLSVAMLIGCAKSSVLLAEGESIPVPESAYDVQRHLVEADSFYQIDYKINVPYPETKTAEFYAQYFTKKGWHVCSGKGSGDDWSTFIDSTDAQSDVPTRRLLRHISSKKEKKLVLLMLRYYGVQETRRIEEKNCAPETRWKDNVQHVSVILYDLKDD